MPPTYEYECEQGHTFEVEQSIKDDPLKTCPLYEADGDTKKLVQCRAAVKRLISPTNFVLKGSGWAKDGYGSGGEKKGKEK